MFNGESTVKDKQITDLKIKRRTKNFRSKIKKIKER